MGNYLFDQFEFLLGQSRWQDLVDIVLVTLIVYRILLLVKSTGIVQMLSGLGILALAYISSLWIEMYTLGWLLEKFFSNLFVIVVVLFQGEIRRALAQIGANPLFSDVSTVRDTQVVEEISKGIILMAQKGYGGLIVVEQEILADYYIEFGTEVDAKISAELLTSIFHPAAPMHDGAVLLRGSKVHSAGCFLPLSKNPALDKNLGTRHRAAIGLTEETDALVFVISEENKSIGIVQSGRLQTNAELSDVRRVLFEAYGLQSKAEQS